MWTETTRRRYERQNERYASDLGDVPFSFENVGAGMMQRQSPSLSVGLPVYNGEAYLEIVLETLLEQTFEAFEIVISDNASTDRTADICRDFEARDLRIRYTRNEFNIGAAPNFNQTFQLSTAPLFKWAAHDDIYVPSYLESCLRAFESAPDMALVHTGVTLVNDRGQPLRFDPQSNQAWDAAGNATMPLDPTHLAESASATARFDDVLHRFNWCLPVFGVIRSDLLRQTGLQRSYYGVDKVLLAELALLGRFHQVERDLFQKRVHNDMSFQLSTAQKRKWIDPRTRFHIPQLLMLKDYITMTIASDLPSWQKLRCLSSVSRMVGRNGLWQRIFVPGPDNYLGINFKSSA